MNINYAIELLERHANETGGDLGNALTLAITAMKQVNDIADSWSKIKDTGWLSIDDVVNRYRLPKSNISNRKWRIKHNFPKKGFDDIKGKGCRVVFHHLDVEDWIYHNKKII